MCSPVCNISSNVADQELSTQKSQNHISGQLWIGEPSVSGVNIWAVVKTCSKVCKRAISCSRNVLFFSCIARFILLCLFVIIPPELEVAASTSPSSPAELSWKASSQQNSCVSCNDLSTKTECDYLNGWIFNTHKKKKKKNWSHTQKSHPEMVDPRDIAGECRRRCNDDCYLVTTPLHCESCPQLSKSASDGVAGSLAAFPINAS